MYSEQLNCGCPRQVTSHDLHKVQLRLSARCIHRRVPDDGCDFARCEGLFSNLAPFPVCVCDLGAYVRASRRVTFPSGCPCSSSRVILAVARVCAVNNRRGGLRLQRTHTCVREGADDADRPRTFATKSHTHDNRTRVEESDTA
jgi:hypothetical protein